MLKEVLFNMTKHTIASSKNSTVLNAYLDHQFDNANGNVIYIKAQGSHANRILAQLSAELISYANGNHEEPAILSIEGLDYGSYSTMQLKNIINQIMETLDQLNNDMVSQIFWSGSRMTLMQLLMDHETHAVMQKNRSINHVEINNISPDDDEPENTDDSYVSNDDRLSVYELITK